MKITKNEFATLKAFGTNEYSGEGWGEDLQTSTWMFTIQDYSDISKSSFPGVAGSLSKKGLLIATDDEGAGYDARTLTLTNEGVAVLKQMVQEEYTKIITNFSMTGSGLSKDDVAEHLATLGIENRSEAFQYMNMLTDDQYLTREINDKNQFIYTIETSRFMKTKETKSKKDAAGKAPAAEMKVTKNSKKGKKEVANTEIEVTLPAKGKKEKVEKPKKEKVEKPKKVGVISVIVEAIEKAGKNGVTKDQIHEKLIKAFPDRDPEKMRSTINVQVPGRINKERFKIEKTEKGGFKKA